MGEAARYDHAIGGHGLAMTTALQSRLDQARRVNREYTGSIGA